MFYYEDTGKLSKAGEIQRKVIVEVRKVTYINPGKQVEKDKEPENIITEGFEPVREAIVSPEYLGVPKVVGSKTVYHPSLK